MTIVAKAYARYLRVSPRKIRQIINLIRGENANSALASLAGLNKGTKRYVEKALKSAISNARRNPAINTDELFIFKISADKGPTLKRYRAQAMGRAAMIRHRTTHLTIELGKEESHLKQSKKIKRKKR